MTPMRMALLAAATLAGLALLGAAAYLYTARAPVPPPARLAEDAAETAPSGGSGFAFTPYPEPRPIPELRFTDGAGRELSLADFRGRVVLLNIWATWCVPCRKEMPALDRLQAALGGPDFAVVALSIDRGGLPVVEEFYRELGLAALPVYVDRSGTAARELGALGLPTTLLVDCEGREVGRVLGAAEWERPEAVAVIRRYLETRSNTAPQSRCRRRRRGRGHPREPCLPVPGRITSLP